MKAKLFKIFILITGICLCFKNSNANSCQVKNYDKFPSKFRIIGINGDWGYAINSNKNFNIQNIPYNFFNASTDALLSLIETNFDAKKDYAYGGALSYGFLFNNRFEINGELAYHQVKNIDKIEVNSSIKSDIMSIMLNGIFYANLHPLFQPYVNLGLGLAHNRSNGNFSTSFRDLSFPEEILMIRENIIFNNLKNSKLAYQSGLGLNINTGSSIMGIGYKFFGLSAINEDDNLSSDFNLILVQASAPEPVIQTLNDNSQFKFGKLNTKIHNISISFKKII